MSSGSHRGGSDRRLHARRRRVGVVRTLLRQHRLSWLAAVLLAVAALLPGTPVASTFALGWTAENDYFASTLAAGTLGAPTITSLTASGSSMELSWANGVNGNANDIAVSAPSSSSSCSSSTSVVPLTTLASSATSFTGASSAIGTAAASGEWLCYQLLTAYGAAPVGIATSITSGATVGSIDLSSVPVAISSGDQITLTNSSGQSQSFTAGAAVPASSGLETVPVSGSPSATYSFATTATSAYDATSWTSWTSAASYAAAQAGLVATGVAIANGGTAGQIDPGDSVTITFNQAPNVSALLSYTTACTITGSSNEIILGDETVGAGSCAPNDVGAFGILTSSVALTNSLRYNVTYQLTGSVLTITIGTTSSSTSTTSSSTSTTSSSTSTTTAAGTYTTVAANPTWTYTPPASGFSSVATPTVPVCTATSLCQPTTTTNF